MKFSCIQIKIAQCQGKKNGNLDGIKFDNIIKKRAAMSLLRQTKNDCQDFFLSNA